jgi:hypothetical protein
MAVRFWTVDWDGRAPVFIFDYALMDKAAEVFIIWIARAGVDIKELFCFMAWSSVEISECPVIDIQILDILEEVFASIDE